MCVCGCTYVYDQVYVLATRVVRRFGINAALASVGGGDIANRKTAEYECKC